MVVDPEPATSSQEPGSCLLPSPTAPSPTCMENRVMPSWHGRGGWEPSWAAEKKINQEILSNKSQGKGCGTELSLAVPQTATTVFSQPTARPEEIQSRFKAELKPAANKALH